MNKTYIKKYGKHKLLRCVVCGCGNAKELTIHHVVPFFYHRYLSLHFPDYGNNLHDLLVLCHVCHRKYESRFVWHVHHLFSKKYHAPLNGTLSHTYIFADFDLLKRLAGALVRHSDRIPTDRKIEIHEKISSLFGSDDYDVLELSQSRKEDFGHRSHGEVVVEHLIRLGEVEEFAQHWRKHFVKKMKPKFMPESWDVNHPIFKTREQLDTYP